MVPTAFIFSFSDWFYQLWVPSQDARLLYILTIAGCIDLPIAMPLQSIYNIFPITKNIKGNCLFSLGMFSTTFIVILAALNLIDDPTYQILFIAGTSASFNAIKSLTFLPLYGSKCAKLKTSILYKNSITSILGFFILLACMLFIKKYYGDPSWIKLLSASLITCCIGGIIGYIIVLNSNDRKEVLKIVNKLLKKLQT
jgi:hypothetical protein